MTRLATVVFGAILVFSVAAPGLAKPAAGVPQKPSPAIAKGQGSAGPGE